MQTQPFAQPTQLQQTAGTNKESRFLCDYPDVLMPEEAMVVLSIGKNTLYKLLKSGDLESVRIGKQYRIPKRCILQYLNA